MKSVQDALVVLEIDWIFEEKLSEYYKLVNALGGVSRWRPSDWIWSRADDVP